MRQIAGNCWDKKNWHANEWKYAKILQGLMLRKLYPNYETSKYVLWINAGIHVPYEKVSVFGKIFVVSRDGKSREVDAVVRTPYQNKSTYQLSKTNGRRRGFGTPLVFDSFSELAQVESIRILWVIRNERDGEVAMLGVVEAKYSLNIIEDKNKENRIYTVDSYECCPFDFVRTNTTEDEQKMLSEYLLSFDRHTFATNSKSNGYTKRTYQIVNDNDGLRREKTGIERLSYEKGQEILQNYIQSNQCFTDESVSIVVELEEKLRLEAHYLASIFPEPAFGFENVGAEDVERYMDLL